MIGYLSLALFLWRPLQEPACGGECVCGGPGQPGGLPGLPAAPARILQRHLGLPVLPGHRQLPVLVTQGT